MNVQQIGGRSYLITVTAAELGKDAGAFTRSDAELLYDQAIHNCGGSVRIDVYPGRDEVMIFVRRSGAVTELWEFDDLEDVLSAICEPTQMCDSVLMLYNGRYILALTPWEGDPTPLPLCEFGRRLDVSPMTAAHIREQSEIIIGESVLESLAKIRKKGGRS